jgi:hypothetical protein
MLDFDELEGTLDNAEKICAKLMALSDEELSDVVSAVVDPMLNDRMVLFNDLHSRLNTIGVNNKLQTALYGYILSAADSSGSICASLDDETIAFIITDQQVSKKLMRIGRDFKIDSPELKSLMKTMKKHGIDIDSLIEKAEYDVPDIDDDDDEEERS